MCPSNLTWLVEISVKLSIFIHSFTQGWCVSFLHKVVFYFEQFVVLKDTKCMLSAQSNNKKKSHFHRGNVTKLVGWGDLDTTLAYLHNLAHFCVCFVFFWWSGSFVQPIPWIVVLLQKKVAARKLWRGNGRLRKTEQVQFTTLWH